MNTAPSIVGKRLFGRCVSGDQNASRCATTSSRARPIGSQLGRAGDRLRFGRGSSWRVRAEQEGPAPVDPNLVEMEEQMKEKMKDPRVQQQMKAMQDAMQRPEVQQQVQSTVAYLQSEEMQKKMQDLQDDEELRPMFEELKSGGMGAFFKYFRNEEMMRKLSDKLGPPPASLFQGNGAPPASGAGAPPAQQAPSPPPAVEAEINNLVDAARFGDLEAVEDFLAIGKDPNSTDDKGRTALHFAVATQNLDVMDALLGAQADLEIRDSMENTALHYAAGYGRTVAVQRLLDAGANGAVKNTNGKTPADLARASPENPVGKDEGLMKMLDEAAAKAPAFQDQ